MEHDRPVQYVRASFHEVPPFHFSCPPLSRVDTATDFSNQVMGVGHWGVILLPSNNGKWGLMLTQNMLNPPPKARDRSRGTAKADGDGDGDVREDDDQAGMCPLEE